jgi:hypothetical protein
METKHKIGDKVLIDGELATIIQVNVKPVGDETYTVRFKSWRAFFMWKMKQIAKQWVSFQW